MQIYIKTPDQIDLMRQSGHLLAQVHAELHQALRPGMSTLEIDTLGEELIRKMGGIPNCKNYEGFPASICISVNEEVVHGIPSADRILQEGDIVTFDTGLIYKGWHSDAARTWGVGEISPEKRKLIEVTKQSFFEGIAKARAGNRLYEISKAIDQYVTQYGYGIVHELTGHGIGQSLHEEPNVPNYRQIRRGIKLQKGMTICVEPMITMGKRHVGWLDDDWTVVTVDGSPAAHYENTIVITDDEPEILTMLEGEE
ncbi:type I methionyl aminopeptidase [Butyrivibrio fibrisolvens]|uniref:Methionine aminopeptidase n=1 Tax=Butyrivibrio fibrisolvens TaxID=831 RepID=A0A1H9WHP2_BUTFI|nr:type I methionyl aminopeptidase [Butyrivibrio fibrisolvens]MBQ1458968.1 type I methionyl aminopeptidase [Butyrivibrio sp.]PWT26101.1 type I methionyl aminopeptidase [Butyrivibrio fibrisolvens]SES33472.1 methionyl aminopeptidase [Butyrivibrio fibrisolvens]